jgi:hypothetical protein
MLEFKANNKFNASSYFMHPFITVFYCRAET